MPRIIATEELTSDIAALVIEAPDIVSEAGPGQLVMARLSAQTDESPHTIVDLDKEKGTLTIVVRTPGGIPGRAAPFAFGRAPGTTGRLNVADGAADSGPTPIELTGPVGRLEMSVAANKVLLVAEGLGVPTILPRLRQFKEKGCYTMVIAGYPSKDGLFWVERLNEYSDELYVITNNGSYGIKGPVRHTLRAVCDQVADIDHVLAAGPVAFLKEVAGITRRFSVTTTVTLGAALDLADGVARPGPPAETPTSRGVEEIDWTQAIDLDGHQVDFDDLVWKLGIQVTQ